jgi:L-asparaginase type II
MKRSPIALVWSVLVSVLLAATPAVPAAAQAPRLPRVLVIGTGGTISGEQAQPGTLTPYEMKRSANDLVRAVPVIAQYADVETEEFARISSPTITPEHWLKLANRINEVFRQRPELSGIVVTHGTSRLEETAFFLYLTVKSDRPVVMAAAQRPATGISADGPLNVLSAIRVAGSPAARGMGAMVVMDNRILSARDVKKAYARSGGFETGEMGMLGVVANDGVELYYAPAKRHTHRSDFDVSGMTSLPRVGITYSFAGSDGEANGGASPRDAGLVVATTGFTPAEEEYYAGLRARGVIVATTFPSGEQVGGGARGGDDPNPTVGVGHLSPLKARILLMLALTKTKSAREIQALFDSY